MLLKVPVLPYGLVCYGHYHPYNINKLSEVWKEKKNTKRTDPILKGLSKWSRRKKFSSLLYGQECEMGSMRIRDKY